jgi:hypothetical protein
MLAFASCCAAKKDTRKILLLFDSKSLTMLYIEKTEAGTHAIGEAIALPSQFGMLRIHEYEVSLNYFIVLPPFNIFFGSLHVR